MFSPILDLWNNTWQFVCVVRSLTSKASPQVLGLDPTVTMLGKDEHESWVAYVKKQFNLTTPKDYPTFRVQGVSEVGFGDRHLLTIGKPIWSSLSFLGRGTIIWLVVDQMTGEIFIVKNSWRKSNRNSESEIYRRFTGEHPALAKFESGGDVVESSGWRITVKNLRRMPSRHLLGPDTETPDTVLHRLLLKSFGRSITEWNTIKELLQAMRDAISGMHCSIHV